jgi:chromosome partitioning protein
MTNPPSVIEVSVREFRSALRKILDRARMGSHISVTSNGKRQATLISIHKFKALNLSEATQILSNSVLRSNLSNILHEVAGGQHILISLHGEVQTALIPPHHWQSLNEKQLPSAPLPQDQPSTPVHDPSHHPPAPTPPPQEKPMQILTFWNESGGATKTTMVAELGYLLSTRTNATGALNRVLLIDLDPQRSLTHRMGLLDDPASRARRLGSTLNTVLQESENDFPEPFTPLRMPALRVVPAHQQLRSLENILVSDDSLLVGLKGALRSLEGQYDYVLIDTPPSNGGLTRAALVASNFAVIPMPTHIKSIENLENVTTVLTQSRRLTPELRIALFIPTTFNKGRVQDREVLELVHTELTALAPVSIPITERPAIYRDVIPARGAVGLDQPKNPATTELNAVLDHLLAVTSIPNSGPLVSV